VEDPNTAADILNNDLEKKKYILGLKIDWSDLIHKKRKNF
jgi:hypothetical protein